MILTYLYGAVGEWEDPIRQCNAIMAEYGKSIGTIPSHTVPDYPAGWIPVSDYNNMTWSEYAHSTLDPDYLAYVFRRSYERGVGNPASGRYYYQLFLDNPYSPPTPTRQSKLKIWQMIRYHY